MGCGGRTGWVVRKQARGVSGERLIVEFVGWVVVLAVNFVRMCGTERG